MKRAIFWFRRDLRVADNTGLLACVKASETVLPIFVFEDAFRTGPDVGASRLQFLIDALAALKMRLLDLGYPLIVRHGKSEEVVPALAQEFGAEAVYCNKRPEPYAQARDERVFAALNRIGVGFAALKDAVIWEEREILTKAEAPYTVFTPYAKAWKARGFPKSLPALQPRSPLKGTLRSDPIPASAATFGHAEVAHRWPAGEAVARQVWQNFLDGPIDGYQRERNLPAAAGTSQLSPHLRCGTIGIRTVLDGVRQSLAKPGQESRAGADTFLNELIWREFYHQILFNFPQVVRGSFRPEYDRIEWAGSNEHFEAWCRGRTGYPIIDAAMRCLNATGWMHNRLRMIVAMFLTKDLLIDWRRGERYFMQQLVDGDLAANNGGWQWSAGTGTDAAPYFRIFNPINQARKFDPDGSFVRRWIPELAGLPGGAIHEPWDSPLQARDYPARIVLHEEQRLKALAMYKRGLGKA